MALQILCIGDVGNYIKTLSKFSKSEIHIINWPKADAGNFTYDDEYELFQNWILVPHLTQPYLFFFQVCVNW